MESCSASEALAPAQPLRWFWGWGMGKTSRGRHILGCLSLLDRPRWPHPHHVLQIYYWLLLTAASAFPSILSCSTPGFFMTEANSFHNESRLTFTSSSDYDPFGPQVKLCNKYCHEVYFADDSLEHREVITVAQDTQPIRKSVKDLITVSLLRIGLVFVPVSQLRKLRQPQASHPESMETLAQCPSGLSPEPYSGRSHTHLFWEVIPPGHHRPGTQLQ